MWAGLGRECRWVTFSFGLIFGELKTGNSLYLCLCVLGGWSGVCHDGKDDNPGCLMEGFSHKIPILNSACSLPQAPSHSLPHFLPRFLPPSFPSSPLSPRLSRRCHTTSTYSSLVVIVSTLKSSYGSQIELCYQQSSTFYACVFVTTFDSFPSLSSCVMLSFLAARRAQCNLRQSRRITYRYGGQPGMYLGIVNGRI